MTLPTPSLSRQVRHLCPSLNLCLAHKNRHAAVSSHRLNRGHSTASPTSATPLQPASNPSTPSSPQQPPRDPLLEIRFKSPKAFIKLMHTDPSYAARFSQTIQKHPQVKKIYDEMETYMIRAGYIDPSKPKTAQGGTMDPKVMEKMSKDVKLLRLRAEAQEALYKYGILQFLKEAPKSNAVVAAEEAAAAATKEATGAGVKTKQTVRLVGVTVPRPHNAVAMKGMEPSGSRLVDWVQSWFSSSKKG
ncbi:hypothetical protein HK102_001452 [Quaeritorhiza haematococci]|nr:hypothetical protein HK102_001452 [Quaeritorhiza haematococci]